MSTTVQNCTIITLEISTKDLIKLGGTDYILEEMEGHRSYRARPIAWPREFIVVIDESDKENDTSSIKYYSTIKEDPFLEMGYSDDRYFVTKALLQAVGTKIE